MKFVVRKGVGCDAFMDRKEEAINMEYEYVATLPFKSNIPFASISLPLNLPDELFFARVAPPKPKKKAKRFTPEAAKKVEMYSVKRIKGDGRCMFRALVLGMATNKGMTIGPQEEETEADGLRLAVADIICSPDDRKLQYEEALIAITIDESLPSYCRRIQSSSFWGGESELLVLSRLCSQPITVYVPEAVANRGSKWGSGFVPIQEYGSEFTKSSGSRKGRKPVKLLYNGSNHYDLLL